MRVLGMLCSPKDFDVGEFNIVVHLDAVLGDASDFGRHIVNRIVAVFTVCLLEIDGVGLPQFLCVRVHLDSDCSRHDVKYDFHYINAFAISIETPRKRPKKDAPRACFILLQRRLP